ncbi:hypothetical protein [Pedobacter foliorum]|uniref:hypothetical protein n=1 Tax=Pedobacter foliorum TaxID=2739058 RepID=UPI001566790C|nr:hypothetical protein [Pedobacter foliorum]NRF40697.1 hypothetical protein [Pedobacter foliorum]
MAVIDRIELSAKSKSLKILNICGAIYLAVWLFMVLSAETFKSEYIKTLLMGGTFWSLLSRLWSKDAGLFIEWRPDQVEFKTHNGSGLIDIKMLKHIDVGLDEIKAYLEKDEVQVINIARFSDYDTRLKIKEHFSQLQKELKIV